jgi:hypothetical protein
MDWTSEKCKIIRAMKVDRPVEISYDFQSSLTDFIWERA